MSQSKSDPLSIQVANALLALLSIVLVIYGLRLSVGRASSWPHVLVPAPLIMLFGFAFIYAFVKLQNASRRKRWPAVISSSVVATAFCVTGMIELLSETYHDDVGGMIALTFAAISASITVCLMLQSAKTWCNAGNAAYESNAFDD